MRDHVGRFFRRTLGGVVSAMLLAASSSVGSTFVVSTTSDSGPGSLRQAILDANASLGADAITFAIPGAGVQTIVPSTLLPPLTDMEGVTIDGFSQSGASPNTLTVGDDAVRLIEINGTGFTPAGLDIFSNHNTVRGLIIRGGFLAGIRISGSSANRLIGNLISTAFGRRVEVLLGAKDNAIGGTEPDDRNVISGNFSVGIFIRGIGTSSNLVQGNLIGTDPSGSASLANHLGGIFITDGATDNSIGGTASGAGNVVSGNNDHGISIGTSGNVIQGNRIGTNASGTAVLRNRGFGVLVFNATDNTIGGTEPGAGNVISGNMGGGIDLAGSDNLVVGNLIGTDVTGAAALGNRFVGIRLRENDNTIGGTDPGAGNVIAFTLVDPNSPVSGHGIQGFTGIGNRILGNSTRDNGRLGIDLFFAFSGDVTPNDSGDFDIGPNNLQNFPDLIHAMVSSINGKVALQAMQDSNPAAGPNLLSYYLADDDPSGHGEGKAHLLSVAGLPGAFVDKRTLSPPVPVSAGDLLTATATTNDGTSEFSQNLSFVVNQAPIARAGANKTVQAGSSVTLNGSGSTDPDGLPNGPWILNGFFSWTQTSGPVVTLANPMSGILSFTPGVAGTYVFSLVVSDGLDLSTNSATVTVAVARRVAALSPARVWIGLKNSDDVGTRFDLRAEVLKNGSVIGSGQVSNVPGGGSGFNNALLNVIALTLAAPADFLPDDVLSIRLSVRAGATGHRSGTARLWFNDAAVNSRFDATIDGVVSDLYLRDGFSLGTLPGFGPKKTIDVGVDRAIGGNPFKPFGTWSKTF